MFQRLAPPVAFTKILRLQRRPRRIDAGPPSKRRNRRGLQREPQSAHDPPAREPVSYLGEGHYIGE
jgi:hypothetical protein